MVSHVGHDTADLAEYLFTRVHQLGVRSMHGVPGDYNLTALDYIEPTGIHWVGNASELNAGECWPLGLFMFSSFFLSFFWTAAF